MIRRRGQGRSSGINGTVVSGSAVAWVTLVILIAAIRALGQDAGEEVFIPDEAQINISGGGDPGPVGILFIVCMIAGVALAAAVGSLACSDLRWAHRAGILAAGAGMTMVGLVAFDRIVLTSLSSGGAWATVVVGALFFVGGLVAVRWADRCIANLRKETLARSDMARSGSGSEHD